MKIKVGLFAGAPLLVLTAIFLLSVAPQISGDGIRYTGYVCIYKNGELITCKHNIITDRGKDLIKMDMMGTDTVTLNVLAVANNTAGVSASDTNLQGEWTTCNLSAVTVTPTSVGTGNWSLSYEFTSTCDSVNVNAVGVYNETKSGNLFAETTWSPTTVLNNGDKLRITYYLWVQ